MLKNILLLIFILTSVVLFVILRNSSVQEPTYIGENSEQQENIVAKDPFGNNSLDLSDQDLDKLPDYVLSRTNLEELDISNNNISGALPAEIKDLTNLKVLNASNNKMTGVPAEIGQLSKLEVLDLSNNQLTGLPYELGDLKNLKTLDLSGNDYAKQDLERIKSDLPKDVELIL